MQVVQHTVPCGGTSQAPKEAGGHAEEREMLLGRHGMLQLLHAASRRPLQNRLCSLLGTCSRWTHWLLEMLEAETFLCLASLKLAWVDMLGFMEQRPCTQSSKWQVADGALELIPVEQILQPVVQTYDKDGSCICLTLAPLSCPV